MPDKKIELPKKAGTYEVTTAKGRKAKLTFQPVTQRWYLNGHEVGTDLQVTIPADPEPITSIVETPLPVDPVQ